MKLGVQLRDVIAAAGGEPVDRLAVFAFVSLGVVESLASGSLSATDAIRSFFNADNCLYVRKTLKQTLADRVMSHGVQLADIFDVLPAEDAQREYLHELAAMRSLCIKLLESEHQVA